MRSWGSSPRPWLVVASFWILHSCSSQDPLSTPPPTARLRTFRMGFSPIPPRPDQATVLPTLEMWTRRADAGILHVPPPWDSLLAGVPAAALVERHLAPITNYYRAKGLAVVVTLDATDGLDRAAEAPQLVAAGRSLTEPAIQQLYRRYAVAIDSLIQPAYLGLAAETNLIRVAAPDTLYAAVRQVANATAADLRARDSATVLYVSVQVDVAWGAASGGDYQGIDTDLGDFPFLRALGLSSYPYLAGFHAPADVPLDYYARLTRGLDLPALVVEGGWVSESVGGIVSSPETQARWLRRHIALLDSAGAVAVFQLTFADLDLASITPPPPPNLAYFTSIGLVDADLVPKPALAVWDSAFARPFR